MLWWKFAIFLVSFSKPHASFSSIFTSLFSVMKDNSSGLFWVKHYILCTKGINQSGNFKHFECSGQNSPDSSHFWSKKAVSLWILHQLFVSWDINFLYFFSLNFIYFKKMNPMKAQTWWNFAWAIESLKFCTLMGSFGPNQIQFQLKKYRRVIYHDTEVYRKTDLWFQIWHEEFGEFSPNHTKVWKFIFKMDSFFPKYTRFELQIYRGVIFHDTEQWCKT